MSPPNDYDAIWSHIDGCAECNRDLSRLCRIGRERLEAATTAAAEALCPVPATWVQAKPGGVQ